MLSSVKILVPVLLFCIFTLATPTPKQSHSCLEGQKQNTQGNHTQLKQGGLSPGKVASYKKELNIALRNAKKEAQKLKRYIEKKQLQTKVQKEQCKETKSLRGVPQLESGVKGEVWEEVLSDDFRRLSVMREFVHLVLNNTDKGIEIKARALDKNLKKSLCYLEILSDHYKHELSYDITSAVVPRMYKKDLDKPIGDRLNCVIARDTEALLKNMGKCYTNST